MNVTWLIDYGVFSQEVTNDILDAIATIGVDYKLSTNASIDISDLHDSCLYIPYGSVGMVQELSKIKSSNLVMWYKPECLSWGAISKNWGRYVLNSESVTISLGEFRANLPYFYDKFGEDARGQKVLFIKPFENDKSFTGMLLLEIAADGTIDKMVSDKNYFDRVNFETMVVVSRPKVVLNEWRFFILHGKIIAATQYNKNRTKHYEEGCAESGAIDLAMEASSKWNPDEAYSLDICESNGKFYVMEIGCMNCSDLYAANKLDFFGKITEAFITKRQI